MVVHSKNVSLAPYNTFGIDVKAAHFINFQYTNEIADIFNLPELQLITQTSQLILILGGGSNLLLSNDIKGVVLKNDIQYINIVEETTQTAMVEVGAGVPWQHFVDYTINKQWGGIENLSLIPGSVGAAPMQNIGAYGIEVSSVIEKVNLYHIETKQFFSLNNKECCFGYRDSIFKNSLKNKTIICSVVFKLQKNPVLNISYGAIAQELKSTVPITIKEVSEAIISIRRSKLPDPAILGNAGSFFKNPIVGENEIQKLTLKYPDLKYNKVGDLYKIYAGWLIENAGWKGYRKNQVGCYEKQALILVNFGHAQGRDVLELAQNIQRSVLEKFFITLEMEVNLIQ
jgi:UDP-N-acetylmuramate dehydrogenase